ncbi:hypothetical protein NEIELOOT_02601 [Neisseria elongata subsp. glycolytica ATCC 29315]|uniref:Uncharacterized protein n=1 Tax=Neisseria elongata subsp. glycolytica ATCC 29315 TaxID=546263 RepID=D4DU44_NEIEG|nr:hypothetical protein NEIELOOT_02601 [Neisseria elongata subsp. glycolytica ATCC 29315]
MRLVIRLPIVSCGRPSVLRSLAGRGLIPHGIRQIQSLCFRWSQCQ